MENCLVPSIVQVTYRRRMKNNIFLRLFQFTHIYLNVNMKFPKYFFFAQTCLSLVFNIYLKLFEIGLFTTFFIIKDFYKYFSIVK